MSDRLASLPLPGSRRGLPMAQLVFLPIGTNGYVSTWGAPMSVCPPPAS